MDVMEVWRQDELEVYRQRTEELVVSVSIELLPLLEEACLEDTLMEVHLTSVKVYVEGTGDEVVHAAVVNIADH